ncbi:hypothetical protein [Streptomyces sp. NBC_01716]|uniref:hypothetical protein n=1 Tax=Streptomyces sp. NBC_01716 TaxID=2975917 RepID=UPI002E300608|nr:hypothetical protein [Streptomyces sp. NBC_01716]
MDAASEAAETGLGRHRDELRPAAVRQLLRLRESGELATSHVKLVAGSVDVSVRQVWRWLAQAEETGSAEKPARGRFRITEEVIAIARDLDPGFMAGLREGTPAARSFDPAFQRPAVARNQMWEGDHKQAPTVVMMPDQKLSKLCVTWFEDRGTGYVMGWAVTAGSAHRGSVPAAVRASVVHAPPYGPVGGLPHLVRVDGGADFLSKDRPADLQLARGTYGKGAQRPPQGRDRAAEPHLHDPVLRRPAPLHQGTPARPPPPGR